MGSSPICVTELIDMEIKKDAWDKFISIMDMESDISNFKVDFKDLSKKYGQAYIVFTKAMWEANTGVMSEDEFMFVNGKMSRGFFEKVVKGV